VRCEWRRPPVLLLTPSSSACDACSYAPFCKHVFMPNFTDTKANILDITPETEPLIRTSYEARTAQELPV
jgi:hypothetical protein